MLKIAFARITIRQGSWVIHPNRLEWPGDILLEAVHIATAPPSQRAGLSGRLLVTPAEEMAPPAWSYAAALAAGIDPTIVCHEGGYKQGGSSLRYSCASGLPSGGPGVPMLQWWRMTSGFPRMDTWLRLLEDPARPSIQFPDPSHVFTRVAGIPPTQYRGERQQVFPKHSVPPKSIF